MSVLKRILRQQKSKPKEAALPSEQKTQELAVRNRQAAFRLHRLQLQEDMISRRFKDEDRRSK